MACPFEADSEIAAIGKFMTGLKHLELRFSRLTAKRIESISERCLNLEFLYLLGCVNVGGAASSTLSRLRSRILHFHVVDRAFIGVWALRFV
ncbi:unnamed protein product [Linum trigynum]|uniref:Uncharacterized protein n=1 Tax=Linum trigynum TaxID=586398 RepID=A0AAV2FZL9_9ROSI